MQPRAKALVDIQRLFCMHVFKIPEFSSHFDLNYIYSHAMWNLASFVVSQCVLFCDAKVCGRNPRALGMMVWGQFHPTGKEHATKATMINSIATGNYKA